MTGTGLGVPATTAVPIGEPRDRPDHHLAFWKRFMGTVGSRGVTFVLAAAASVIIARVLGPEGQGIYSVLLTVGLLGIQIGTFGLNTATAYYSGALRAPVPRIVGFALTFAAVVGSALGLVLLALQWLRPGLLPLDGSVQSVLVALYIPLGLVAVLAQALLLGLGRIAWYNLIEVLQVGATLAAVSLIALLWTATPELFYALALASTGGAAVVGLTAASRGKGLPQSPDRELSVGLLRYGARSYLANLLSFVVLYIDLLMVAQLLTDADAGHYAIAARIAEWAYVLPVAGGAILFSTLVEQEPADRRRFTVSIVRKAAFGMPVMLLLVGITAPVLVPLLYGEAFLPALLPLYWLLPAIFALGLHTLIMNHCAATGMPWIAVIAPAVGAALNVVLNVFLIPKLGIQGAALASLGAYASMLALSLGWLLNQSDKRTDELPG